MKNIGKIQPIMGLLKIIYGNDLSKEEIYSWLKYQMDFLEVGDTPKEVLDFIQLNNRKLTTLIDECILDLKRDNLKTIKEEEKTFTSVQLQTVFDIDKSTFSRWIEKGVFPTYKKLSPRKTIVPLSDVLSFIKENPKYKLKWDENSFRVL